MTLLSTVAESILSGPSLVALLLAASLLIGFSILLVRETRVRRELRESESTFREIAEKSSDLITRHSTDGVFRYVSPVSWRLLGYTPTELIGRPIHEFAHADDVPSIHEYFATLARESFPHPFSYRMLRKDGGYRWLETTSSAVDSPSGEREVLAYSRDITDRKQIEEHIEYAAYHDELTGLPNRTLFNDRLTIALAAAHRFSRCMAVMFLDLDHFKRTNDTFGHRVGDLLLEEVGNRLTDCMRITDTVARMGGDEFTILLSEVAQVDDTAKVATKVLESLSNRFVLDGHHIYVSASIGLAMFPRDGQDAETLLKNADSAMYRAKNSGRNRYMACTAGSNSRFLERLTMENNLRRAFEREEFVVHYQPVFDMSSSAVVGMEALIRWDNPEQGLLSPADFLNVAEDARLMLPMGEWVLRSACRQAKIWKDFGSPVDVSVNLSEKQLHHADLTKTIERALEDSGAPAELLALEIQESALAKDVPLTLRTISAIRKTGVKVTLDDFGTGNSSFGVLRQLDVDQVKIAPALLHGVASGQGNGAILSSVITAAQALDLTVVGKGVESPQQCEFLRARGCDQMQGYLFGVPAPALMSSASLRLDH